MGHDFSTTARRLAAAKMMSLLLMLAFVGSAFGQVVAGSPEGSAGGVVTLRCRADSDCPSPVAQPGQESACLVSRCVSRTCAVTVLPGQFLGRYEQPSDLSCFKIPVVCDAGGGAVPSSDPLSRSAIRENEVCSLGGGNANPCERPACHAGSCALVSHDGAECSDTRDTVGECQKKECRNRECRAVTDIAKKGALCVNPATGTNSNTADCRTTEYSCNDVGACQGAEPKIAASAECASSPDQLAPLPQLPAAFRSLIQDASTFPTYTCDRATCRLLYCGDSAVNGPEECDGAAFRPGAPPLSRCNKNCKVEWCGDGIRNGTEVCDGRDTPAGTTCSSDCTICGDTVVKRVDLCRGPRTGVQSGQTSIKYWLQQLGFTSYKDAVSTNKAFGTLFTYTNDQGQKCWVDHDMYDAPAPGLGVCGDGSYEKFEFHCSTCGNTATTCYDRFADKPGVQVMALGVAGGGTCVSGTAKAAYQLFKKDYAGYESVLTGVDLRYSVDRRGVYRVPFLGTPAPSNPRDMVTCEVCYWPVCGNGKRTLDEECDGSDLPANAPPGSSCNTSCKLEYCGDGKLNNNGREQCDGSVLPPNAMPGSSCSSTCIFHGSISLQASGTCTFEGEGTSATSIFCRLGALDNWSEGKYTTTGNNAPILQGQNQQLRTVRQRVMDQSRSLCAGIGGAAVPFVGTIGAILTSNNDSALDQVRAPTHAAVDFLCVKNIP